MKPDYSALRRAVAYAAVFVTALASAPGANTQGKTYERTFHESKATIEKTLRQMQNSMAGHLPVLDGFAVAGEHRLDRYRRGYFQATAEVSSNTTGGSVVRISAKITAWYADPTSSHSGYQLLTSNGRVETDILDQLSEQLVATKPASAGAVPKIEQSAPPIQPAQSTNPAPEAQLPESPGSFSSSLSQSMAAQREEFPQSTLGKTTDPNRTRLQAEVEQMEEILKNQAHPRNLAAVKKSGTAVVEAPSLKAKTLFLASAHDEFEILNFNQDWVHVRISGLSRGWIWRNELEMPDDIPDSQAGPSSAAEDLFRVTREETAPFPGDWEPLRGKTVKIISVQKADEAAKNAVPQMKLEFAKSLFEKNYSEIAQKASNIAGIVLIFDSSDGGMIAVPESTLEKWKTGALSDAALWHSCFFDPPETFVASAPLVSQ